MIVSLAITPLCTLALNLAEMKNRTSFTMVFKINHRHQRPHLMVLRPLEISLPWCKVHSLTSSEGANDRPNELAALTAAIATARAEDEALERQAEVAGLKTELHALRTRNAQLQAQTPPCFQAKPTTNQIPNQRSRFCVPVQHLLKARTYCDRLGLSSSDSDDDQP